MRSLVKMVLGVLGKIFLNGLFVYFVFVVIHMLGGIIYNSSLKPLKSVLFWTTPKKIQEFPGIELITALIVIMLFGIVATYFSGRVSSRIPVLGLIIRFAKTSRGFSKVLSKPDVEAVLVEMAPGSGVWESGATRYKTLETNKKPVTIVYFPGTPNFLAGKTRFIEKEKILRLPPESNKVILKLITSAGLLD